MTKISKRPKNVNVYRRETVVYENFYTCPVCHVQYTGFVSGNTTRFMCQCGQELIVNRRMNEATNDAS